MLLKVNLIKSERLLSILNQINNNIQFTVEKSQTKMVQKSGQIFTTLFKKYIVLSYKKNM